MTNQGILTRAAAVHVLSATVAARATKQGYIHKWKSAVARNNTANELAKCKWRFRVLAKSFHKWMQCAVRRAQLKCFIFTTKHKRTKRLKSRSFLRFLLSIRKQRALRRVVQVAKASKRDKTLRTVFAWWLISVKRRLSMKTLQSVRIECSNKNHMLVLVAAWRVWKGNLRGSHQICKFVDNKRSQKQRNVKHQCVVLWKSWTHTRTSLKQGFRRVLSKRLVSRIKKHWHAWASYCKGVTNLRDASVMYAGVSENAASRAFKQKRLRHTFQAWGQLTSKHRALRRRYASAICKCARNRAKYIFSQWKDVHNGAKKAKSELYNSPSSQTKRKIKPLRAFHDESEISNLQGSRSPSPTKGKQPPIHTVTGQTSALLESSMIAHSVPLYTTQLSLSKLRRQVEYLEGQILSTRSVMTPSIFKPPPALPSYTAGNWVSDAMMSHKSPGLSIASKILNRSAALNI